MKQESNASISFLDIKVHRQEDGTFETSVYRKPTNKDSYLHWQSYAPEPWKVGTLKTLIYRAHNNCSSVDFVKTELEHIRRVFIEINGYPKRLVNNVITREHKRTSMNDRHILNRNGTKPGRPGATSRRCFGQVKQCTKEPQFQCISIAYCIAFS